MALWTPPSETIDGRDYRYFIGGEAFDGLLLAERLLGEVEGLVPAGEAEELFFAGRFPKAFDSQKFKDLLGVEKYRGYLNFYYGVTVEAALQLAVEMEVEKRCISNGILYVRDYSEQAFAKIYHKSQEELLEMFREANGTPQSEEIEFSELNEFTYWLFKYRWKYSDKAKIASDTRKGMEMLSRMESAGKRVRGLVQVPVEA
ncbi:MAG: hypothetical protein FJ319_01405 [SAR202 cluster bacterium]|nr:hypothetical protein [SAR202 cluster bacterium]